MHAQWVSWKKRIKDHRIKDSFWRLTATERVHLCICDIGEEITNSSIHVKFPNYPKCRYVIAYLTSNAISKHKAVFGHCRSEQQIFSCFNFISSNFTNLISLKEKQMKCTWRITCLEEDLLVVFPMGFDKRHYLTTDSESDKIAFPQWVVGVSPLENTWKQQVENLKNTLWRIESVL